MSSEGRAKKLEKRKRGMPLHGAGLRVPSQRGISA